MCYNLILTLFLLANIFPHMELLKDRTRSFCVKCSRSEEGIYLKKQCHSLSIEVDRDRTLSDVKISTG